MNLTDVFMSKRSLMERLFECVSSYDIFCSFIGEDVKVGEVILSPIRKITTYFHFVPRDKDEVYFKDFAWQGGNVFKFVKLFALYQESINLKEFTDVVHYIDQRMGIGLFGNTKVKPIQKEYWTKRFMPLKDHKIQGQRVYRERLSVLEKLSYF
jgi:hypothetical protein